MRIFNLLFSILIVFHLSGFCLGENEAPFSLRVESLERGKVLFDFPVQSRDRFSIHYIHSSDKTPIQDIFEVGEKGEMILIEENYLWYGAGLECMNWEGASVTMENDKVRVHLKRHFPFLPLRVGRIANHSLHLNGKAIPLREIARGGELLKIWVEPVRASP
jgi:hypothetical protein